METALKDLFMSALTNKMHINSSESQMSLKKNCAGDETASRESPLAADLH